MHVFAVRTIAGHFDSNEPYDENSDLRNSVHGASAVEGGLAGKF